MNNIILSIERMLSRELKGCNTILDLGCGNDSPIQYFDTVYSVGVDAFEPYLRESKDKSIHNDYVQALLNQVEFKPDSFDAVLLLFALEHMEKVSGKELLMKMKRWATKKIVLATPNGYIEQVTIDNNPFMEHKSGWTVEELYKMGFKVKGLSGWKRVGNKLINDENSRFWGVIADLTQIIAYHYPEKAFQLFAVYDVK